MPPSHARVAAFDILFRVEKSDSFVSELLHSDRCSHLSSADRGLMTELVMGVLRWRSVIDSAIAAVASHPIAKIDAEVLTALRLGTYQLGWLDRIPPRAAIYESVELIKAARKRSAAPFANAILRKLAQSGRRLGPAAIESVSNAKDLAQTSAHPGWLVERWAAQFGFKSAQHICRYDQTIPVTAIRLRFPSAEQSLQSEGVTLESGVLLLNARRVISGDVTRTKAFTDNLVAIQDEASQLVATLLGSGSRFLDCCAAPGGKTWALADRNPGATIVAVELHPHRAELLKKRVRVPNLQVISADVRDLKIDTPFDRVLVDAPCSGTGTLARNPDIKWRLQPHDLTDLHARQVEILRSAMKHVAVGGRLIYATCSLEREEDEAVIDDAIQTNQSFRVIPMSDVVQPLRDTGELVLGDTNSLINGAFLRTIPGIHNCDGFFVSTLERVS